MSGDKRSKQEMARELNELRRRVAELESLVDEKQHAAGSPLPETGGNIRTVLDAIQHAIHVVDTDLKIIWVNACYRQWALSRGLEPDVVGRPLVDAVPFLNETHLAEYRQVLESGESLRTEEHNVFMGHDFRVDVQKIPDVKDGRVTGVITVVHDITDRILAQEKLAEERNQLRTLIDTLPDHLYIKDRENHLMLANRTLARDLGIEDPEELTGTMESSLHPADLAAMYCEHDHAVMHSGQPATLEEPFELPSGERRMFLSLKAPLRDRQGNVVGVVGASRDITSRIRSEQALRESEERARLLASRIRDVVWITDRNLRFTYISPSIRYLRGISPEEAMNETIEESMTPESYQKVLDIRAERLDPARAARDHNAPIKLEIQQKHSNGSLVWVEIVIQPMVDGDGRSTGWIGVSRDITERKEVEQALRNSEERYRTLAETAGDIIMVHDLDGHFTYFNRAGLEFSGYSEEEVSGLNLSSLLPPDEWERMRERAARRRAGDFGRYVYEAVFTNKAGERVSLEVSSQPLMTGGDSTEMLIVARDISQRQHLEAQLRHAQKMETLGRLAGGIAHDFNNLLTIIHGYAHFVKGAVPNKSPARDDIEHIIKAVDRSTRLTTQLLAFSRRQMIQPRALNLNHLILEMGKMLRRLIGEDIELVILPQEARAVPVKADPTQIEQVIINLAVNARDAMPDGGTLTIRTGHPFPDPDMDPNRYVLLSVQDTGTGMTAETREHLFEPFFTTKDVGKGTGLGLATVYGIIKQHHGDIRVQSNYARGTTFHIYLPRAEEPEEEQDDAATRTAAPRGCETILVVEDEPSVRRTAVRILQEHGYSVLEAGTGDEALRLVRQAGSDIDLLLTDVVMPKMNGVELAGKVKDILPGCRVLFTSGYTDDVIIHHGVLEDPVAFLEKPYSHWSLPHKVRQVLDAPPPGEEARPGN